MMVFKTVNSMFQHTAARRRLDILVLRRRQFTRGFNTQPPEGGWTLNVPTLDEYGRFQHTAARRRLVGLSDTWQGAYRVSTHSRPKAAGA